MNGAFVRTESGRSYTMNKFENGKDTGVQYARLCQASRKDYRNAVEIAKGALKLQQKVL